MTWEPKNKLDDEDVDVSDDDDRDHSFNRDDKSGERHAPCTNRAEKSDEEFCEQLYTDMGVPEVYLASRQRYLQFC